MSDKKILYLDMDNVLVDFKSGIDLMDTAVRKQFAGKLDEVPGVFSLMDPMEGALEAYADLSKVFDTYILSTAPWENPSAWSDKVQWVKQYLGEAARKRLILTHHKNLNRGHFLVDDRTNNGAGDFEGEHIVFGVGMFPNWAAVRGYLLGRAAVGN